jgi:hypothetical protein
MKKQLFVFVLMIVILSALTGCGPGSPIQPNPKAGTPVPSTQINVPGFSIQLSTPGTNPEVNKPDANGHPAGILLGIWHGVISPVTLVLSFVNPVIQMYEVHNDGSQYNLGFLLGVALVFMILGGFIGSRR